MEAHWSTWQSIEVFTYSEDWSSSLSLLFLKDCFRLSEGDGIECFKPVCALWDLIFPRFDRFWDLIDDSS